MTNWNSTPWNGTNWSTTPVNFGGAPTGFGGYTVNGFPGYNGPTPFNGFGATPFAGFGGGNWNTPFNGFGPANFGGFNGGNFQNAVPFASNFGYTNNYNPSFGGYPTGGYTGGFNTGWNSTPASQFAPSFNGFQGFNGFGGFGGFPFNGFTGFNSAYGPTPFNGFGAPVGGYPTPFAGYNAFPFSGFFPFAYPTSTENAKNNGKKTETTGYAFPWGFAPFPFPAQQTQAA
jgi:hypothetical protein